jgi:hypothetical protein
MLDPPQLHTLQDVHVRLRYPPQLVARNVATGQSVHAEARLGALALAPFPYSDTKAHQLWAMFVDPMVHGVQHRGRNCATPWPTHLEQPLLT